VLEIDIVLQVLLAFEARGGTDALRDRVSV